MKVIYVTIFNGVPFSRGRVRIYTLGTGYTTYYTILVQIDVILIQTVSSNLAIRSVPNSAVELSRRYLLVTKSFRSMQA